jgi:chromosomal replication initiator protein
VTVSDLWQKVVENIKLSIASETYNLWVSPLKPLTLENNIFTLEVPNVYFSQWIKDNQKGNIEQTLSNVYGQEITLNLKTQEEKLINITEKVKATIKDMEHIYTPVSMTQKDQINPKYIFSDFIVGTSNRFAHGCSEAVAKKPGNRYNPLFLYSGVGLGKTHLLHSIGNYIKQFMPVQKILYATCEKFVSEFIEAIRFDKISPFKNKYRGLDCLLIDDIQFLIGKESSQEEFFHMFNSLFDLKKQIVISSDRPPKELKSIEERLISRFEWGVVADILQPDLETRIAILRKKVEEWKIYIPNDIIVYIATKIKSNVRQLESSIIRICAFSVSMNTPLNIDIIQELLKDIIKINYLTHITIENIQETVANDFNIDIMDMKSKRRTEAVVFPRQIAMYLARTITDEFSTNTIGDAFGGRDHSTVMHACNKIKEKMSRDPYFNAKINQIVKKIYDVED